MSRLIDADSQEIKENTFSVEMNDYTAISVVPLDVLDKLPTIDAKPVTRCKDCKYWDGEFCEMNETYCEDTDFCSYGERRVKNEL